MLYNSISRQSFFLSKTIVPCHPQDPSTHQLCSVLPNEKQISCCCSSQLLFFSLILYFLPTSFLLHCQSSPSHTGATVLPFIIFRLLGIGQTRFLCQLRTHAKNRRREDCNKFDSYIIVLSKEEGFSVVPQRNGQTFFRHYHQSTTTQRRRKHSPFTTVFVVLLRTCISQAVVVLCHSI